MADTNTNLASQFMQAQDQDSWWDRFRKGFSAMAASRPGVISGPLGVALGAIRSPSDVVAGREAARTAGQDLSSKRLADVFAAERDNPGMDPNAYSQYTGLPGPAAVGGYAAKAPPAVLQTPRGGTTSILPAGSTTPAATITGQPFPSPVARPATAASKIGEYLDKGDIAGAKRYASIVRSSSRQTVGQETPLNRMLDLVLSNNPDDWAKAKRASAALREAGGKPDEAPAGDDHTFNDRDELIQAAGAGTVKAGDKVNVGGVTYTYEAP